MKARVVFEVQVEVDVPDDFCDRARQLQRELGAIYIGADWTDQQILERTALIRGLRGHDGDESLDDALNDVVKALRDEEDVIEFELIA